LKLKEVQDDQMFGLIADKGFAEGEIMYTETPLISALYPSLEVSTTLLRFIMKPELNNVVNGVGYAL
jgi:hypothetical protein